MPSSRAPSLYAAFTTMINTSVITYEQGVHNSMLQLCLYKEIYFLEFDAYERMSLLGIHAQSACSANSL